MTSHRDWSKPDLLQQRRVELGLPFEPAPVPSRLSLLLKGGISAVVLVMLSLLTVLVMQHRQQVVQGEVAALNPVEKRVGDAKVRLKTMKKDTSTLKQQTKRIAAQLVALRSGSGLLEQMRQVTPEGVRLLSVAALPSQLLIKGEAEGNDAFERINALALNLEVLVDVFPYGTTVQKATSNDDGLIAFSLEVALDPSSQSTPERLRELGANGLARRYELLQEKGIAL
jgi:type IV pilus assembly protein PilN